jgi:hypothetical protein
MQGLIAPIGIVLNSIGVFANAIGLWKLLKTSPVDVRDTFDPDSNQEEVNLRNQLMRHTVVNWIVGGCFLQVLGNLLQLLANK